MDKYTPWVTRSHQRGHTPPESAGHLGRLFRSPSDVYGLGHCALNSTLLPKQNRQERRAARADRLRQLEMVRMGGKYRTFRMTATENTLSALAKMPDAPNLNRLPGHFVAEMPEGRLIENGLESPDSMVFRMIEMGFQPA